VSSSGGVRGVSPSGWTWHHVPEQPGVLQGLSFLGDVLEDWRKYELDDSIYVSAGTEPSLDTQVNALPFDRMRKRVFEGQHYLLGIEQVRDVVEGLERQLERPATPIERRRAGYTSLDTTPSSTHVTR
jgi:hypothetical protein